MQYDVTSPEEYLEALEEDWRKTKLLELRKTILSTADDISEGIEYKMLSFADPRGTICHLNAQKNFVALYVGDAAKIDHDGSLLAGINCGKGCVRFKKSDDVQSDNIQGFVARAVAYWKEGRDISC